MCPTSSVKVEVSLEQVDKEMVDAYMADLWPEGSVPPLSLVKDVMFYCAAQCDVSSPYEIQDEDLEGLAITINVYSQSTDYLVTKDQLRNVQPWRGQADSASKSGGESSP